MKAALVLVVLVAGGVGAYQLYSGHKEKQARASLVYLLCESPFLETTDPVLKQIGDPKSMGPVGLVTSPIVLGHAIAFGEEAIKDLSDSPDRLNAFTWIGKQGRAGGNVIEGGLADADKSCPGKIPDPLFAAVAVGLAAGHAARIQ